MLPRNLIELFVPAHGGDRGGLAAARLGVVAAAAVCTAGIALVIQVGVNPSVQRDDWRGLVRALGPTRARRLLVVTPEVGKTPLELYAGLLIPIGVPQPAAEIDLIANARPPHFPPPPAPPGFAGSRRCGRRRAGSSCAMPALAGEPAVGAVRGSRRSVSTRAKDAAVFLQTPAWLPPP